jgi:uncharacterized RDD family membrane protein YckC
MERMNESEPNEDFLLPESEIKFSNFWNRFGASMLDGILIIFVTMPLTYMNVTRWKIPALFILSSLIGITYKPFMEYRYGATFGKMALHLRVVGRSFGKVTLQEELRRVSFYLIPEILQQIMTFHIYFTASFLSIRHFQDYNELVIMSNPGIYWLNGIVFSLGVADCITFLLSPQRRALHDLYAGTYVIES